MGLHLRETQEGEIVKASNFCAGATTGPRKVESIHPAREIATTGTPEAFMAKPAGDWGSDE